MADTFDKDYEQRALEQQEAALDAWRELQASAPNLTWQPVQATTINPFDQRYRGHGSAVAGSWRDPEERIDPRTAAAMREAFKRMQRLGRGEYTLEDRAVTGEGIRNIAAMARGGRDAAVQAMEMRGLSGGGAELAARLAAEQNQANAVGSFMAQQQAAAQQRALQAMQQTYGLGYQQVRDREADSFRRASAVDAFNAQNTNWQRQAAMQNAATQTAQSNLNAEQQRAMQQQMWGNQATAASGLAGQYSQGSQQAQQQDQFDEQQALQRQQMQAQAVTGLAGSII